MLTLMELCSLNKFAKIFFVISTVAQLCLTWLLGQQNNHREFVYLLSKAQGTQVSTTHCIVPDIFANGNAVSYANVKYDFIQGMFDI